MTSATDIVSELSDYVRNRFDVEPDDDDFSPDVHLYDYGYVDSFGAEELLTHVETAYGVPIDESTMLRHPLNTIREIAAFVAANAPG